MSYIYIVGKDEKMSKPIKKIKKYIRHQDKIWDIAYGYEYVNKFKLYDGLACILYKEVGDDYTLGELPPPT